MYSPPKPLKVRVRLGSADYDPADGERLTVDLGRSPYQPPHALAVRVSLGEADYQPPHALQVRVNLTPDQQQGEAQYAGGDGSGLDYSLFGTAIIGLKYQYVTYASGGSLTLFGLHQIRLGQYFIRSPGLDSFVPGIPGIKNRNVQVQPNGLLATAFGRPSIKSMRSYIQAGALNSLKFGAIRISYKEQKATTTQKDPSTLWGNTRIAYGVRYVEHNSTLALTRFGMAWASYSPRYIEPRGLFQLFESNHVVGISRSVKMEGVDFARFGSRIIPESQVIYPQGFSTLFGDLEIHNYLQHIQPKGFLTVGEHADLRFGHVDIFNSTQYVAPFHDDSSLAAGERFPEQFPHQIVNRNRHVYTHGVINQRFGYQELNLNARLIAPVGIASPIEITLTKSFIAHSVRRLHMDGIEPPYFSTRAIIYLGAKVVKAAGRTLSLFGTPHVENTRRFFRFISLGEQSIFGQAFISQGVRHLRFDPDRTIAPPQIPMPEVKLGRRFIEPLGIDSVRYGLTFTEERFTKIAPRWVYRDMVGEPVIRNLTPELKAKGLDMSDFGKPYIGLYTRGLQTDGLSSQIFGRLKIGDLNQSIDMLAYGIAAPTISRLHKIERIGAGKYITQNIFPRSIEAPQFPGKDNWHKVTQNVLRPESDKEMTLFGNTRIHANSIRVEPGLWEILIGKPTVEYKNRTIRVDSASCDFLEIGKPRMSPHTIWAVVEAPDQAKNNHYRHPVRLHYVDGLTPGGNTKEPGVEFGTPKIGFKNARYAMPGLNMLEIGKPTIINRVYRIEPKGMSTLRMGTLGPIGDQTVLFRPKDPQTLYGKPVIQHVPEFNSKLKPSGFLTGAFGRPYIDFYHREIKPAGIASLQMGVSIPNDKPYMWQGLRIGLHVPTRVGGEIHSKYGTAWISPRVREILPDGLDFSLVSEYAPGHFKQRMTVRNLTQPDYPLTQVVRVQGLFGTVFGVPDIKPVTHYIRPDGNMDNYRKGAF